MSYIQLNTDLPGLLGLFAYSPSTAEPLLGLIQAVMEGPSSLSQGERELIGSIVAKENDCAFCVNAHGAFAAKFLNEGRPAVDEAHANPSMSGQPPRVQALIDVAIAASKGGHEVTPALINTARSYGATDQDIHDAILIASVFALFTRYVDGLRVASPQEQNWYADMAEQLHASGYAGMAEMLRQATAQPVG